jgi:hypothetical protein
MAIAVRRLYTDLKGVFAPSQAGISMIVRVQQLLVRCSPLRFPAAINFSQIARAKTQSATGGAFCFPKSTLFTKGFTFSSLEVSTVRRMPPSPQSSAFGFDVAEKKNVEDVHVAPPDLQSPHPFPDDSRSPADPVVSPTNLLMRTALFVASVGLLTAAAIDCLSSDLPTVESRLVNETGQDCSKGTATPSTIGGITQPSESSGKQKRKEEPSIVLKLFSFYVGAAIASVVLPKELPTSFAAVIFWGAAIATGYCVVSAIGTVVLGGLELGQLALGQDFSKGTVMPPTIGGITQPSESSGKRSLFREKDITVRQLLSFAAKAAIGTVVLGGLFIYGALQAAFLFKGGSKF